MKQVALVCLIATGLVAGANQVQAQSAGNIELENTYELFDRDCRAKIGVRIQDYIKHTPAGDKGVANIRGSSKDRKALRVARELKGERDQLRICTEITPGVLGLAEVSAYFVDKNRNGVYDGRRDALVLKKIECLFPSGDVLGTYFETLDGEFLCAKSR